MKIQDYNAKLRATIGQLEAERTTRVLRFGTNALALINRRIIEKGERSDGGSFGSYSQAIVPFWMYENKESKRNSKKQAALMREKVGYFASYKDWREQNGLQTNHKDFSFTNRMWPNIQSRLLANTAKSTTVRVGAIQVLEKKKVKWITEREGELLRLSPSEIQILENLNIKRVQTTLKKNGL